jgi:hypothetical protein
MVQVLTPFLRNESSSAYTREVAPRMKNIVTPPFLLNSALIYIINIKLAMYMTKEPLMLLNMRGNTQLILKRRNTIHGPSLPLIATIMEKSDIAQSAMQMAFINPCFWGVSVCGVLHSSATSGFVRGLLLVSVWGAEDLGLSVE